VADWAPTQPQFWVDPPAPGAIAGGSRWFEGANETMANPTLTPLSHGQLAGVTIGAPDPYTVAGVNTTYRRFFQNTFTVMRAADVEVVWEGGQVTRVFDRTHDVSVPFHAAVQAGYGFIPDADGNGVNCYTDTRRLDWVDGLGGWRTGTAVALQPQPVIGPTDITGDCVSDGQGFGMILNGEPYWFIGAPPAAATWVHRSYFGEVEQAGGGYTFTPAYRPPTVPGLVLAINVTQPGAVATNPSVANVHTVPDPYYVRSAADIGPSNKVLRFVNLPETATVRIYTLNGTLVRVLEHNDPLGGGDLVWDLRNRNNQFVASGVYFFVAEGPNGNKHTGKFTVVQFTR
jgi:hypothetical protein